VRIFFGLDDSNKLALRCIGLRKEKEVKTRRYCLILGVALLVVIAFGCATSPFHETPKEKCLALCQADLEDCKQGCEDSADCKQGCEDSADFEPGAAQCVDQCQKALYSCNEKCPD
jgi:hypothetical protein